MRLLADMHISPRTVDFLRGLGHDVVRVDQVLPANAPDELIIERAIEDDRTIVTQDLDFSALIAVAGRSKPSVISLRLSSARVERVNEVLDRVLPQVQSAAETGAIISVEDQRIRRRDLPIS